MLSVASAARSLLLGFALSAVGACSSELPKPEKNIRYFERHRQAFQRLADEALRCKPISKSAWQFSKPNTIFATDDDVTCRTRGYSPALTQALMVRSRVDELAVEEIDGVWTLSIVLAAVGLYDAGAARQLFYSNPGPPLIAESADERVIYRDPSDKRWVMTDQFVHD